MHRIISVFLITFCCICTSSPWIWRNPFLPHLPISVVPGVSSTGMSSSSQSMLQLSREKKNENQQESDLAYVNNNCGCTNLIFSLNILRDGWHFGVNESRKSSTCVAWWPLAATLKKYHDTKSGRKASTWLLWEWWEGGNLRSCFPDLCSDQRASTHLINPTLAWAEVK